MSIPQQPRPTPFTLILDALLRPGRLVETLASGPRAFWWGVLAAAEVIIATAGMITVLGMLVPLGGEALIVGPTLAVGLSLLAALPAFWSLPYDQPVNVRLTFTLLRTVVAVGAPLALGFTLVFSRTFPHLQSDLWVIMLFLTSIGLLLGGALTVALMVSSRRSEAPPLRLIAAAGAFVAAALIWWSTPLRQGEAFLAVPFLAGLAIGLLRPLSYLWEAPLSGALALAARLGAPPHLLLQLHPVAYDDLCLLPLPGLPALLVRTCAADVAVGGLQLLAISRHASQGTAARRALERLARSVHAHPALFWLSVNPQGAAWLRQLAADVPRPHPLITTYAALAAVHDPAAWPTAITPHLGALAHAAHLPGGAAVQALVEAGAQTIAADRWPAAMRALHAAPPARGVALDPLWQALETVRSWSDQQRPTLIGDQAEALALLWEDLDGLDGWPAALLGAMTEHLVFLLIVERRRGAWMV